MEKIINIVICDDDVLFVNMLNERITEVMHNENYPCVIIDKYSGTELMEYCSENSVDIVITDVDMPGMTGFDVIQKLQNEQRNLEVIFVTSHEEYAYQAYDYQPFWFVSKRHIERIGEVIKKLLKKIKFYTNDICCLELDKIYRINIKEIYYFKSHKHYVYAYAENEPVLKMRGSVRDVYSQLKSKGFILVQQRYVINCRYIERFDSRYVSMSNKEKIPVTRDSRIILEAQRLYSKFLRELI